MFVVIANRDPDVAISVNKRLFFKTLYQVDVHMVLMYFK